MIHTSPSNNKNKNKNNNKYPEINKIESKYTTTKLWHQMGETSKQTRPLNSLLSKDLVINYKTTNNLINTIDNTEILKKIFINKVTNNEFCNLIFSNKMDNENIISESLSDSESITKSKNNNIEDNMENKLLEIEQSLHEINWELKEMSDFNNKVINFHVAKPDGFANKNVKHIKNNRENKKRVIRKLKEHKNVKVLK
ncbi:hypothetical protein CDIK_2820 [Cucumispora dikerogammari]|nr:hypothetical protein CDIK_2820 [Cucumispora dikerogammari]